MVAIGACLGLFHVLWNLGVALNGAAVSTIQQAAMPVIVTLVAWLLWREQLGWTKAAAIVLTFVGTLLVSGLETQDQGPFSLAGLLVGIGIPTLYACWNLINKKLRQQYETLTVLTFSFGFGALALLPFQFFVPHPWPVPLVAWFSFAGLILLTTVFGFSLFTFSLSHLPVSVATIVAMSEIAFASIYAYFLLDERLTTSQILGAIIIVIGVLQLLWPTARGQPNRSPKDSYLKKS
jgi:drug/metabolite transporter (DMT)-like permease